MRVISGIARGTKLIAVQDISTRPTLDRVKEALFNILQLKIEDSTILDLFAGTGALGVEALSRGASSVVFCDKELEAIKVIKQNVKNTKFENQSTIINKDYILALKKLAKENQKFNIIFLDPPYKTKFAIYAVKEIINMNLLTEDGIIIIETDDFKIESELLKIEKIEIFDKRKYGSVWLIFMRKE